MQRAQLLQAAVHVADRVHTLPLWQQAWRGTEPQISRSGG
jgi:hypothetical protein